MMDRSEVWVWERGAGGGELGVRGGGGGTVAVPPGYSYVYSECACHVRYGLKGVRAKVSRFCWMPRSGGLLGGVHGRRTCGG